MSLSNSTKEILVVAMANRSAANEISSAIDALTTATASEVTLNGVQTLTNKTIPGMLVSSSVAISAAGTNQATATAITADENIVTTVAASTGVVLPTAVAGKSLVIVNKGANALSIYPALGASIDALAANAAISLPVNQMMFFDGASATQWYSSVNLSIASAVAFSGSLVGDVTGTQGATVVSSVGGSTAANVHNAELAANAATELATASTIMKRGLNGETEVTVLELSAVALGNFATGGVVGTAAATVDVASVLNIAQTTAAQTLSLPSPTHTEPRSIFVSNTGSTSFTIFGQVVAAGAAIMGLWTGAAWVYVA